MKIGFIIAEYNPFHNGHKYHITKTRENGAGAIVAVMSGNYVQRGEVAIYEKHLRAKNAIEGGADLVLELPLKYALSSADKFAFGGISVIAGTGLEGFLSFGAGCDIADLEKLKSVKNGLSHEDIKSRMLEKGCSYPSVMAQLIKEAGGDSLSSLLDDANNVLALEYICAAESLCPALDVLAVKRRGVCHDSDVISGEFASASYIRNEILSGRDVSSFVPATGHGNLSPVNYEKADLIQTALLSQLSEDELLNTENIGAGFENRIIDAIKNGNSFSGIALDVKTKRYTLARLRRTLLSAALGITRQDIESGVSYLRVLGANSVGRELLHTMRDTAKLPVVANLSDIPADNKKALRDAELDYLAGKYYNLSLDNARKGNTEYNIPPVMLP